VICFLQLLGQNVRTVLTIHIRLLFLIRTEKESNSQLRLNRSEITEFEKLIISSFYYRLRILAVSN